MLILKRDPPRQLDDSDVCRRLLLDKNGMVYDFALNRLFPNSPSLRLQHSLPFSFTDEWQVAPAAKTELDKLLGKVFDYWLAGDGPVGKSFVW